jgi:hypothetical protein
LVPGRDLQTILLELYESENRIRFYITIINCSYLVKWRAGGTGTVAWWGWNNSRKSIKVGIGYDSYPYFPHLIQYTGVFPSVLLQMGTDYLLAVKSKLPSKDYSTSCTETKRSGMKNENLARNSGKWIVFLKCCLKKLKSGSKTKIGA